MPEHSNSDKYTYQITCRIDDKTILDSINISIYTKNILVIIGPGGSGKSTLLSIFEGYYKEHCETSHKTTPFPPEQTATLAQTSKLSYIFSYLLSGVADPEVAIKHYWQGTKVKDLLLTNIDTPPDELPEWLKRLFIITDFMVRNEDKEFWLLDEPEQQMGDHIHHLAKLLMEQKKNKTIIVVTHNMAFTELIADHVLYIHYGNQRAFLTSEEFFSSEDERIKYIIKMGC